MNERIETTDTPTLSGTASEATGTTGYGTDPAAGLGSAAAFASAESQEILNLLNDTQGGSCCGGSCCSV